MKKLTLRQVRIIVASLFFAVVLFTLCICHCLHSIFITQIGSSFLKLFFGFTYSVLAFVIGIIVITLLFGRIYCSILCPLGILQDIMGIGVKKYYYKKWLHFVKYPLFIIVVGVAVAGFLMPLTFLLPSANFISIINHLFSLELIGSLFALSAIIILLILVRLWGRVYCNTVCPVGAFLSLFAKFSYFKIKIDPTKCVSCKLCEKGCKASCINAKEKHVDNDNCLACFSCLEKCKLNAIHYTHTPIIKHTETSEATQEVNASKRQFLYSVGAITGGLIGAIGVGKYMRPTDTNQATPNKVILPPGAGNFEKFNQRCVGCGLCVNACKGHVLEHASTQYGLRGFMQPFMNFAKGFCHYDCKSCMNVCPVGALENMPLEKKQALQLGKRDYNVSKCIPFSDKKPCGKCAEVCPTHAITIVKRTIKGESIEIPKYVQKLCIGCGACEHVCPTQAIKIVPIN